MNQKKEILIMENFLTNRAVRTVLFAAVGGAAGYLIGSFIVNRMSSSNIEEIVTIDEEEVSVKDITDTKAVAKALRDRPRMHLKSREHVLVRDYAGMSTSDKGDLNKLAAKYREVPGAVEVEEEIDSMIDPDGETNDPDRIHVISEQEYNERPEVSKPYTKTILHYYEDDDVVTDEGDEPISHPERIIGEDALVSFGEGTTDPDLVFVLNPQTGDMYQIIRMHKNYKAGSDEISHSNKALRRSSRKKEADEES